MTPISTNSDLFGGGALANGEGTAALRALITQHNALIVNFNLLLAKLDADATVTDTDYESTLEIV